jgi:hypothetical protein
LGCELIEGFNVQVDFFNDGSEGGPGEQGLKLFIAELFPTQEALGDGASL